MSSVSKLESPAVNIARAHIDAWSKHDYEKARKSLADDVHVTVTTTQPIMAPTDTVGVDKYMEGLVKFTSAVEPGSVRIIGSTGDDHNALLMITMKTALGPGGTNVMLSGARLYLINDQGKISGEQVIFFVGSG